MTRGSQSASQAAESALPAFAFTDLAAPQGLAGIDPEVFRSGQIAAVMSNAPAMAATNAIAAGLVFWAAWDRSVATPLVLWLTALLMCSALVWMAAWWARRRPGGRASAGLVETVNGCAVAFAVLWALPPAICSDGELSALCLLVMAIVMGAAGFGAFGLAGLPSSALLFTSLLNAAVAASSFTLGGTLGLAASLFSVTYGLALTVMIVGAHKTVLLRAADAAEIERQREIINLLLKDFEAGAGDWLWETGPGGELVYVSERLCHILGRERGRLIGVKLHQAAGMSLTASGWRSLAVAMAQKQPVRDIEVPVRRNQSTMWWQLSARPLHDASGAFRGYSGVGTDITARRRAALEMLRAKEAAERASAAKSRFLATMSHELRTPLNAIVGFSEIIAEEREGPVGNANYAAYARSVLDGSRHLASLINDILDITRIEKGAAILVEQDIDPVEVAEVVVKMCSAAARASGIAIVHEFAIAPVNLRGDLTRLQQIMINLVDNAVKFTPAGGTVHITLERDERGGLEFVVADTGIGIAKHEVKRIFEPFVHVEDGSNPRSGRVGLGLAISRRLARLHGGDIVIASRPGKGTVARLSLPPARITLRPPRANVAAA